MKRYCGIDLGKRKCALCVMDSAGRVLGRAMLESAIGPILEFLGRHGGPGEIECAFESCSTWYWLGDGLMAAGYRAHMAHTLALSMITRAKVKTDVRDAQRLAELLRTGQLPEAYMVPREQRLVRDLVRQRQSLVRKRAEEFISLKMLATRHGLPFVHRNEIQRLNLASAEAMFPEPSLKLQAVAAFERINQFGVQIADMEKHLQKKLSDDPFYREIQKLEGVGVTLGLVICLETSDISRFASLRDYCSYCRVVPGVSQSGASVRRGRGSKQGNPHLKSAFSQAAVAAVRHHALPRAFFEKHLARRVARGGKMVTYNIIAHKLATAAWHVLHGRKYDPTLLFKPEASK